MFKAFGRVIKAIFSTIIGKPFNIVSIQLNNMKVMQKQRSEFLKDRTRKLSMIKRQRELNDEVY